VCIRTGHTFQKYTQSHSVYKEQAKDKGYKLLQLCDSLQTIYNSELKRLYEQSGSTNKCQAMLQCVIYDDQFHLQSHTRQKITMPANAT
jgi:hypothetical protein